MSKSYILIGANDVPISHPQNLKSATKAMLEHPDSHVENERGERVLGPGSGWLGLANAICGSSGLPTEAEQHRMVDSVVADLKRQNIARQDWQPGQEG